MIHHFVFGSFQFSSDPFQSSEKVLWALNNNNAPYINDVTNLTQNLPLPLCLIQNGWFSYIFKQSESQIIFPRSCWVASFMLRKVGLRATFLCLPLSSLKCNCMQNDVTRVLFCCSNKKSESYYYVL